MRSPVFKVMLEGGLSEAKSSVRGAPRIGCRGNHATAKGLRLKVVELPDADEATVRALLEGGAKRDVLDARGYTALESARAHGHGAERLGRRRESPNSCPTAARSRNSRTANEWL